MNFYLLSEEIHSDSIEISDDQVHHFKNVSRGKVGDSVKVFNGKGVILNGIVTELKKKNLTIEVTNRERKELSKEALNLILCVPKKEYVESIFRSAVQIGIRNLYLIHTKFSPWKFKNSPRLDKILTGAMVQSENPFLPEITFLNTLEDLNSIKGKKVAFLTEVDKPITKSSDAILNFIIGPEGGFHEEEISFFEDNEDVFCMKLPAPIMKAETAVNFGAGFLKGLSF
jgi:16S rRNA (uracil1498-N3)-methyltransferase